jgi:hypothetical protein
MYAVDPCPERVKSQLAEANRINTATAKTGLKIATKATKDDNDGRSNSGYWYLVGCAVGQKLSKQMLLKKLLNFRPSFRFH